MKAITLDQPTASFIARGLTDVAVVSHPAPASMWGERIALQASKSRIRPAALSPSVLQRCKVFGAGGTHPSWWLGRFPLGVVIATASLRFSCEVIPTPPDKIGLVCARGEDDDIIVTVEFPLNEDHGYEIGRHLWFFQDVELLAQPVAARGRAGLWNWDPPADAPQENPRARRVRRTARHTQASS